MSYTREQIEDNIKMLEESYCDMDAAMLRQLLAENDALREDAARWKQARNVISAESQLGGSRFVFNMLKAPMNVMRGSVAEHFTKAIDAARK